METRMSGPRIPLVRDREAGKQSLEIQELCLTELDHKLQLS